VLRVLLVACLLAPPRVSAASSWQPVRVHLECQGWGRTKACPAFLRGFIDQSPVLVHAPLADAQVVLYYNVTFRAGFDRVHLRLVSELPGAPRALEVAQEIDSRAADDEQRAELERAFLRGVAPFVAAVLPDAVRVELRAPGPPPSAPPDTTPWGASLWAGGFGSWTDSYRSLRISSGAGVSRVTGASTLSQSIAAQHGVSRQPPLVVDGEEISLDTSNHALSSRTVAARNLGDHLAAGLLLRTGHEDPAGRYRWTARGHLGASYDLFPADDGRGNALALAYLVGAQADRYNAENDRGERAATFFTHGLLAGGSVRRDRVTYGVQAALFAQLLRPLRRHVIEIEPSITLQIGAHLDVDLSASVAKQAVPGPGVIDTGDFEAVTRASYAEPLQVSGSVNFQLHWDRSNADRNNRWQVTGTLGETDSL